MSDDPFATPAELAIFLRRDVDTNPALQYLAAASSAIRRECGWDISAGTSTLTLDSRGGRTLFLPTLHLTAVTSITARGTALEADDYTWSQAGMVRRESGCWPDGFRSVTVVIESGYEPVPDDLKQVCMKLAAGEFPVKDTNLSSVRIGQLSMNYAADSDDDNPMTVLAAYTIPRSR